MKAQSHGKRQPALDDALNIMLEYREALESSLSRYMATPLGIYEENGRVYSSQLAFFHRLITGQWQKVAVTRSPFYETLSTPDVFSPPTPVNARRSAVPASSAARRLRIIPRKPIPVCWTRCCTPKASMF